MNGKKEDGNKFTDVISVVLFHFVHETYFAKK